MNLQTRIFIAGRMPENGSKAHIYSVADGVEFVTTQFVQNNLPVGIDVAATRRRYSNLKAQWRR